MNREQYSDAYWTAKCAPYFLAAALAGFAASLLWTFPSFVYIPIGILSGILALYFNVLRWRSGRAIFQLAAGAFAFVPFFFVLHALQGKPMAMTFQYVAVLIATYNTGLVFLRRRILRGDL